MTVRDVNREVRPHFASLPQFLFHVYRWLPFVERLKLGNKEKFEFNRSTRATF